MTKREEPAGGSEADTEAAADGLEAAAAAAAAAETAAAMAEAGVAVEAEAAAVTAGVVMAVSVAGGVHRNESMMGWGTGAL